MAKTKAKTNAIRILDTKGLNYNLFTYDASDGKIDGISVAHKINQDVVKVYKTLVAQGASQNIYIFVIPVSAELDLKKAAKVVGEKKIELIPVKDILKWTGYIRGGCSPIGMKKQYPTFIDISAEDVNTMIISGGKIGVQIELALSILKNVIDFQLVELTTD